MILATHFFSVVSLDLSSGWWLLHHTATLQHRRKSHRKRVQEHFLLLEGQRLHFLPSSFCLFSKLIMLLTVSLVSSLVSLFKKLNLQAIKLIPLTDRSDWCREGRDCFSFYALSWTFWCAIPVNSRKAETVGATHHWLMMQLRLQKLKQCNKIPLQIKSGINSHAWLQRPRSSIRHHACHADWLVSFLLL